MIGVAATAPVPVSCVRAASCRATAASAAGVRRRNTSRGVIASPAARARLTRPMATMLSPPSSKKLSCTPTDGRPSTSATSPTSVRSAGVRGWAWPVNEVQSGSGSSARSSFPLGVSGSGPSWTTTTDGTMYSGSASATWARAVAASAVPTTYPTRRFTLRWSSRTTTAACWTSGCDIRALSTSPGSIR